MLIFALDASSKASSVALVRNGDVIYEAFLNIQTTHSEALLTMCDAAFKNAMCAPVDVDLYAVTAGPGSFTGLRIALALIKGLAAPFDTPCVAVSTLEALALSNRVTATVCAALDARRGEVYYALFDAKDGEVTRLCEDTSHDAAHVAQLAQGCPKPLYFVGDGAALCYNKLENTTGCKLAKAGANFIKARAVALAATRIYEEGGAKPAGELTASYLKLSQAERELRVKNGESEATYDSTWK